MKNLLDFYRIFDLAYGTGIIDKYESLMEMQYWFEGKIREYQEEKLKAIVTHAYNNVEYYHTLFDRIGIKPADIRHREDLEKIPLISREDLQNNSRIFMSKDISVRKVFKMHTSGTTGIALQHVLDREAWAWLKAISLRNWSWAGWNFTDKVGLMTVAGSSSQQKGNFKNKIWLNVQNLVPIEIMHMDEAIIRENLRKIEKYRITHLRGYPSGIYSMALFIQKLDIKMEMKSVMTTAEVLYPYQRKVIEDVFGCRVFDAYGTHDGCVSSGECERHKGLHLHFEPSIVQIVDPAGRSVPNGREGDVVATALFNYAMPLIRYKVNDRATMSKEPCSCGRNTPLIKHILGRSSEIFRLPNGRIFNGLSMPLEDYNSIEFFQIVHAEPDRIDINIIGKNEMEEDLQKDIKDIQRLITFHAGEGMRVNINLVEKMEYSRGGKFRYVISKVNYDKI